MNKLRQIACISINVSSSSSHKLIRVPLASHKTCHEAYFPEEETGAPRLQNLFLRLLIRWPALRLDGLALATAPSTGGGGDAGITVSPAPRHRKCPSFPSGFRRLSSAPPSARARNADSERYLQPEPSFPAALVATAPGQRHPWRLQKGGSDLGCHRFLRRNGRADAEMPPGGLTTQP